MKNQSEKSRRAKIAYAFECAKQYLWSGRGRRPIGQSSDFICHCLSRAHDTGEINGDVYEEAKHVVMSRLQGYSTLDSWLWNQEVKGVSVRKKQAHRLAWLNLLIKEFQGPAK